MKIKDNKNLYNFLINYFIIIFIIVFALFLTGCDLQKLWGYEYKSDPTPESAKIYGRVTNNLTSEPIKDAVITIQNKMTSTDENGNYTIYYHYTEEEDRNVPVSLKITQPNYLPVDSAIVIFPVNEINVGLSYASPIIQKICMVDSIYRFQAIVFDYQGFDDIENVIAHLAYRIPEERYPSLYLDAKMTCVMTDSLNTSYYQLLAPDYFDEYGGLMNIYEIYAEDRLKYSDLMTSSDPCASDSLLFPIVY